MRQHLIIYAKRPLPGYAKTRLGKQIGLAEAAGVYARLLYQCLLNMLDVAHSGVTVELSLASAADLDYFRSAFPEFLVHAQVEGDLGQRFAHDFQSAFENSAQAVVVIGTDIPDLDKGIINAAYKALHEHQVVIGPDLDGGYYLIGTTERKADLFKDIDWSSESVLQQTERLVQTQGLSIQYLPTLSDIDTVADYQRWRA
jgi:rSAM/selenodomain-associated transferase 1